MPLFIGLVLLCVAIVGAYFKQGVLKGQFSILGSWNINSTLAKYLSAYLCFPYRPCVEVVERR